MFSSDELLAIYPELRRFGLKLTRNASRADDLLHDTVVRMLEYGSGYREGTSLRAWGFKLMYSVFVLGYHRTKMRREDPLFDADSPLDASPEARILLRDALGELNTLGQMGEACLLHALCGSVEEVAELMKTSVGTVKSRVHRARTHLDSTFGIERTERRQTCMNGRKLEPVR